MCSKGQQNFEMDHEDTRSLVKGESQSLNTSSNVKDKYESLCDGKCQTASLADDKCQTASSADDKCKTASLDDDKCKTASLADNKCKIASLADNKCKTASLADNKCQPSDLPNDKCQPSDPGYKPSESKPNDRPEENDGTVHTPLKSETNTSRIGDIDATSPASKESEPIGNPTGDTNTTAPSRKESGQRGDCTGDIDSISQSSLISTNNKCKTASLADNKCQPSDLPNDKCQPSDPGYKPSESKPNDRPEENDGTVHTPLKSETNTSRTGDIDATSPSSKESEPIGNPTGDTNTTAPSRKESGQRGDCTGDIDSISQSSLISTKPLQSSANTTIVASPVSLWRDKKFWIQIGIVGAMQLAFCVLMSVSWQWGITNWTPCRQSDVASDSSCTDCCCGAADNLLLRDVLINASQKSLKEMLDRDWETRKTKLAEDLSRKFEEKFKSMKKELEGMEGQLNLSFSEIGNIYSYIAFGILVILIGSIIFLYKPILTQPMVYRTPYKSAQMTKETQLTFDTITEKMKRKEVKRGMLIVSFHPSTQRFHLDTLKALSEFMKSSPVKILIQSPKDLMDVEPHKLVIVFVDFNKRNIILENEETEIGDLRNKTTSVFLSLWCDVFVVYCKDEESSDLHPENLYNPKLHSIDRHPVLSVLKRNNRVLSINDKFHPHQVEHLKMCCQQL